MCDFLLCGGLQGLWETKHSGIFVDFDWTYSNKIILN